MKLSNFFKAAAFSSVFVASGAVAEQVYVATTAIVEHPALDAVRDGVKDYLVANGYQGDKLKFSYESAQGNPATAAQIARKLVGESPDVIVAIATPSAQAAVAATKEVPVVFSAVTDPLGARLVKDLDNPGANVTGLSDLLPLAQHLDLLIEIMPGLKKLGVPYNPGEPNAVSLITLLKKVAKEKGITIVEAPAPKSSDVALASQKLVGSVDAIYCLTDNTIISALEAVVKTGINGQVPVFAADTGSVKRGAVAALGFDYYNLGQQTGEVVVRVLKGEKPGDIPVSIAKGTDLVVNPAMAKRMGIELPASVVDRATEIIQ